MLSTTLRVAVVGNSASGKSTLAREISSRLHLPYYSIDEASWTPAGVLRSESERREIHDRITEKSHWVVDGNSYYSIDRASHVIYVRASRPLCMFRCIKRAFKLTLGLESDFIPTPLKRLPRNLAFIYKFPSILGDYLDSMNGRDSRFRVFDRGLEIDHFISATFT